MHNLYRIITTYWCSELLQALLSIPLWGIVEVQAEIRCNS